MTNFTIPHTKITPPQQTPTLLLRPRLLELLVDLLAHKLILITAQAGYGKTSLLITMTHHAGLPLCWYMLEPTDTDPYRFLTCLLAAITQRFPNVGARTTAVLSTVDLDEPDQRQRLVTTFVNEAYDQIHDPLILVLDDYYLVEESDMIARILCDIIQAAPPHLHLILASRTPPALPDMPRFVSRSMVGGLDADELAFQPGEIQALIRQNYQTEIPDTLAQELATESEGWITGLLLSTQSLWRGMADRLRTARVSGVGLYNYLADQVLDQQPPYLRDLLLRTALLEEFDDATCADVLGPPPPALVGGWPSLIDTLLRLNLFVARIDQQGTTTLRYHHLFREFLQTRCLQTDPTASQEILLRLAARERAQGEWARARAIYTRLKDDQALAEMLEEAGPQMLVDGRQATLALWLQEHTTPPFTTRPFLTAIRGMVLAMRAAPLTGLPLLNQAVNTLRATHDPRLAAAVAWRAVVHRFLGDYDASQQDADETLALSANEPAMQHLYAEALRAKGLSFYMRGDLPAAQEWLSQSLAHYQMLHNRFSVALLSMEVGNTYVGLGRHSQALAFYQEALQIWEAADNIVDLTTLRSNLGAVYLMLGDYEKASYALHAALTLARQLGYLRSEASALAGLGDIYTELDMSDSARTAYQQAFDAAVRSNDSFMQVYTALAEARLASRHGESDRARQALARARPLVQRHKSPAERGLYELQMAYLTLIEDQPAIAIEHAQAGCQPLVQGEMHSEAARAALLLAAAAHQGQQPTLAEEALTRAFHHADYLESLHPLIVAAWELRALLKTLSPSPRLAASLNRLRTQSQQFEAQMARHRRHVRQLTTAVPATPPKLAIYAFDRAQVCLDTVPISGGAWQSHSARALFFHLLAHPAGLTKEEVSDLIWPESSFEQIKLNFKTTVYRLRKALALDVDAIIYADDHYRFNFALDYEYDVETFERTYQQAKQQTDPAERAASYQTLLDLHKGPYLPDIDADWVPAERQRLWRMFVEAVHAVVGYHLSQGSYHEALAPCTHALRQDPCLEEVHRLAMRVHAALGNTADVVRQYQQCCEALLEEVGVPPAPETEALYQKLINR